MTMATSFSPRRGALLLLVLGVLAIVFAPRVRADSFPGNYDTRVADSFFHTFCYDSSFTTDTSIATYSMGTVLDNTTDMFDAYSTSCLNATDVWFVEADLAPGVRGSRTCVVAASSSVCDRSNVTLDIVELDIGSWDWYDRRKTAIHEVGHSVGLNHDSISSMVSGEVPSTALVWRRYSSHDISHINTQY